jgi:hypothetical protein
MPYQYKRESLNNDDIDKLINACNIHSGKSFLSAAFRYRANIITIFQS